MRRIAESRSNRFTASSPFCRRTSNSTLWSSRWAIAQPPFQGKVVRVFDRIRRYAGRLGTSTQGRPEGTRERRTHNLFEAAAVYVAARAEDDQDRIEEAAAWVSPEALSFGVSELACRAV